MSSYAQSSLIYARISDPLVKVNSTKSLTASTLLHRLVLLSCTGQVDPARKFKQTTVYGCPLIERLIYFQMLLKRLKRS